MYREQSRLFEDIAEGLRRAQLLVACVSDEYSASEMCRREFRFAVSTLKLPAIIAVVGQGNNWRNSEVLPQYLLIGVCTSYYKCFMQDFYSFISNISGDKS